MPPLIGRRLTWVDMNDDVNAAGQVVKNDQLLRHHQEDIGRADGVMFVHRLNAWLDITHNVVAEIADQAAAELRQSIDLCYLVPFLKLANRLKWVVGLETLDDLGPRPPQ